MTTEIIDGKIVTTTETDLVEFINKSQARFNSLAGEIKDLTNRASLLQEEQNKIVEELKGLVKEEIIK